jgi:RNA polymerase sigma-70 factor (ECF subfamily)
VFTDRRLPDVAAEAVDLGAFDRFYADTVHRTLALARSLTRDWGAAEDLVQDAYADAHRRWDAVGAYEDPGAWVRRAVLNRAASRWRRIGREVAAITRFAGRRRLEEADTAIDHDFWDAVRSLPPQQMKAVVLYYVDDLSVDETADALRCSAGSVKTHLSRARATLHARLAEPKEAS